ncbi:hypothetical protein HYY74_03510 [Candidatus Woesearchaeota archaeon]|nr:hypothetical protein [Candidatus Woesearchaeota archaeon]
MVFTEKRGASSPYAVFLVVCFLAAATSLIVFAASQPPSLPNNIAPIAGFDMANPDVQNYLKANNYFADIPYERLLPGETKQYILKSGNVQDNIRGVEVAGQKYAIDLVLCNWNEQACFFRVNGKATGGLHEFKPGLTDNVSSYTVNGAFHIKVNSIMFDYCGSRRFCNLHFDAYEIVNLSLNTED